MSENTTTFLPCKWCGVDITHAAQAMYGARCFRCYEAYCRAPLPRPVWMGSKTDDSKGWSRALKDREENHFGILPNGSRMTVAQRDMWRTVLGRGAPESPEAG